MSINEKWFKELDTSDLIGNAIFLPEKAKNDKAVTDGELEVFDKLLENKKIIKVKVAAIGPDGSLRIVLGGGLLGVIPKEEVYSRELTKQELERFINKEIGVIVTSIGSNKRIVYLSITKAKDIVRNHYIQNLKTGDTVTAVVTFFNEKNQRVHIDIEGCGLYGYVPISQWDVKYLYDIKKQIKIGSIIKVKIIKFQPRIVKGSGVYKEHFIASRKDTLENPWIGIELLVPVGTELIVTAVHLTNRHNFFATSPLVKDIEIFVEYPHNARVVHSLNEIEKEMLEPTDRQKIIIKPNGKYKVRIYRSNEERKELKARVLEEIHDTDTNEMPLIGDKKSAASISVKV